MTTPNVHAMCKRCLDVCVRICDLLPLLVATAGLVPVEP